MRIVTGHAHRTWIVALSIAATTPLALTVRAAVSADSHPTPAPAAVVADDLIVEGSLCASAETSCDGQETGADLALAGAANAIWFDATSEDDGWGDGDWLLNTDADGFHIVDDDGERVFSVEHGAPDRFVWIHRIGVAIGYSRWWGPESQFPLDVRLATDTPVVSVTHTGTTDEVRTVFSIVNEGPPSFTLIDDSPDAADWFFRSSQSGAFAISTNATDVVEMTLRPGGDLKIAGTLIQSSSADAKRAVAAVDPDWVLDRLLDLDLTTWSYHATPGVTHLGPTAEQFHDAFDVGTALGISMVDADGVVLAGIRALAGEVDEQGAALDRIENRLADLDRRLADLERSAGPR